MENTDQHLLDDSERVPVKAHWAKRLLNWVLDIIAFSILFSIVLAIITPFFPAAANWLQIKPGSNPLNNQISLSDQLLLSFFYGFYMSVLEAVLQGKSIGKFITGTRTVDMQGHRISSKAAFVRGLLRVIPLEPLSALAIFPFPLHDRWSGTMVIDER